MKKMFVEQWVQKTVNDGQIEVPVTMLNSFTYLQISVIKAVLRKYPEKDKLQMQKKFRNMPNQVILPTFSLSFNQSVT